jgi:hypothetical protein
VPPLKRMGVKTKRNSYTSVVHWSEPIIAACWSTIQTATSRPMPGGSVLYSSASLHSLDQP